MATNFPTSLDSLSNPTSSTAMNAVGFEHDVQHANVNDAIEALEAKVGINSSAVTTSLDYLAKALTGTGSPEGVVTANVGRFYWWPSTSLWIKNTGTGNTGWLELITL